MNAIVSKPQDGAGTVDALETESAAKDGFAADVIAGLSARHKQLPPKYFYDAAGSGLFEEICRTREYYVTRSEMSLLRNVAAEVAKGIPDGAALVEFGSGESAKTRLLLDTAPQLSTYVPIDISADALYEASAELARDYPRLSVAPVVADFTGTQGVDESSVGLIVMPQYVSSAVIKALWPETPRLMIWQVCGVESVTHSWCCA